MHIQKWYGIHNYFSVGDVEKIQQLADKEVATSAGLYDDAKGRHKPKLWQRNCDVAWLSRTDENNWLFQQIHRLANEVNDRTWKFKLDGPIEYLQYLEYGPLQHYGWHYDNGADKISTRKLTISIQLSDSNDYWGGDLQVKGESNMRHAPRGRGSVAIFPSHLLHKANPVWLGKRKALIAWIHGKNSLS